MLLRAQGTTTTHLLSCMKEDVTTNSIYGMLWSTNMHPLGKEVM